jgi:hypothetical protein
MRDGEVALDLRHALLQRPLGAMVESAVSSTPRKPS